MSRITAIFHLISIFVDDPLLAFVPALLFAVIGKLTRSRLVWCSGGLWGAYALYELSIQHRLLCSGDCDIRVDLIFIAPILAVSSLAAILAPVAAAMRRRSN